MTDKMDDTNSIQILGHPDIPGKRVLGFASVPVPNQDKISIAFLSLYITSSRARTEC
jgi:hypothetical protein